MYIVLVKKNGLVAILATYTNLSNKGTINNTQLTVWEQIECSRM